jgi:uncharacterized protein (DUF3820 family)
MEPVHGFESTLIIEITRTKMPFGKYEGILIYKLPVSYLEWWAQKGFSQDKLGKLLQLAYTIKINGLEYLLKPILQQK